MEVSAEHQEMLVRLAAALLAGALLLSGFRWVEAHMPSQAYYHFDIRATRGNGFGENELRSLIDRHGFALANFSHRLDGEGRVKRYSMVLRTLEPSNASRLAATLDADNAILEYRIAPTRD